jgi:glucokinase
MPHNEQVRNPSAVKNLILAGDIGGTNTRLACIEPAGNDLRILDVAGYASPAYQSLADIAKEFMAARNIRCRSASFGVPGPVRDGRCLTTNLPWTVDATELRDLLGLDAVCLLNDLEATAYGIGMLAPKSLAPLNPGASDGNGNAAVIAAGTGLGQAGLFWDGSRHRPFATEGGHASFAPNNALEAELLDYLRPRFGHVSVERVLSGPGLYNIYQFLRDQGHAQEPAWLAERLRENDPGETITEAALTNRSDLCARAMDLFVGIYGAEAGNLALKTLAQSGVYLAGGIAPRILPILQNSGFLQAFLNKGRMRPLLESIPVSVVIEARYTGLLGAARAALQSTDA